MSIFFKSLYAPAPAPEPTPLPASDDVQDIMACGIGSRARIGQIRAPALDQNENLPPWCDGRGPAGACCSPPVGVRTRAQNPREWALAIPPESCPAPSPFSSLATVAMPSACKPVGSGDQPEMQRYCVSRWVPAAGTKGMSAVGRAATGKFSSVHGPSTEVGPIGLPSVFPRSPPLGSIVIDEAMSTWTSVLCLLLSSLVTALFFLRSITMPTAPIRNFETLRGFSSAIPANFATPIWVNCTWKTRVTVLRLQGLASKVLAPHPCNCPSETRDSPQLTGCHYRLLNKIATDYARTTSGGGAQSNNTTFSRRHPVTRSSSRRGGARGRGNGNQPPSRSNQSAGTGSHAQATQRRGSQCATDVVKIMYWNIYHDFTLKLTDPAFHDILNEYDIMFFAETDMLPGEDETADIPPGYTLISLPRKPRMTDTRRGGGVALLIRDTFKFKKSVLSSPDILVLDMGTIWLIGAYIPPQSSRWENWTNVEPLQKLWETVALCTQSEDKHVALLSDINARIGSLQASALGVEWAKRWARRSADPDAKKNTRGQAVIDACNLYKLCILNGTSLETSSPGRFTSWQDAGESVIDYAIVTDGLLPFIRSLDIACPTPDPVDDYADHMRICMTVDSAVFVRTPTNISQERQGQPEFAGSAEVDVLYQATMDAKETDEGALETLWGPVLAESPLPVQIYVEGASAKSKKSGPAGAGIFFRPDSPLNMALSTPGPGRLTADRARLFAIHEAIQLVPTDQNILLFCTSKMIIRQLCYSAAKNAQLGWPGNNGDIFKSIVKLLAARKAETCFVHVDSKANNESKRAAYVLAKSVLNLATPQQDFVTDAANLVHPLQGGRVNSQRRRHKVYTTLEENSPVKPKPWKTGEDVPDKDSERSHRGRAKVHALQYALRQELLACKEPKEFWDFVRKRTDPRPRPAKVSVSALSNDFETRLNHPRITPSSFNAEQLAFNARMDKELKQAPPDVSPLQSYTRDITIEEIQAMKRHIKAHGLDTSMGVDGFSYKDCMAIPNEKLLEFFLYCLKNQDIPQYWLTSLLIGILKKDKDAADPASYRLIALECCMLKMLTLIIDRRIREGAESLGVVPVTQNGFQDHLRTNDNVFVLLCLIDKADALGKPLYVAYLDLKNAFPGTDRSTLWVKLAAMGISGPMIEWLKKLYDRIRYLVRLDGSFAPAFRSLLGILTGDPGSPHLWNLFMSDFFLACHPEDIELNGVPISQVEHADDILTASGAPSGFQSHLNGSQRWVNNNGCVTSIPKCVYQVYGRKQPISHTFHLGGKPIARVQKACYLGVWFETGVKFMWREQYKVKSQKATTVANVILGLDRFVGKLPAWDARTLYMARVDPYLTAGCDVCLDIEAKSLALLERVQLKFLRRMLGVGRRSMKAVLFSETGIWPIKYRRVYLALKYLCYLLELDAKRPAANALKESVKLAREQRISWINDLRIVLSRLHVPVNLDISSQITVEEVEIAMKCVEKSMEAWIDDEIEASPKVRDILSGRMELDKATDKLVKKTLDFRHYLRIVSPDHRRALTQFILSSHSLAVERRRWKERGKPVVPPEWRLCRFCYAYIEDPAHAMFVCENPDLLPIRFAFVEGIEKLVPGIANRFTDAMEMFRGLLAQRETSALLGKLAFDVLKVFDASPMLLVTAPVPIT